MSTINFCFILRPPQQMILRTPTPHSFTLFHVTAKPPPPKTLHYHSRFYNSPAISATAVQTPSSESPPHNHHPWPEWTAFVDRLKCRGYFPTTSGTGAEMVYREMNLLKDPCLSFARDRYDIFKSLSKGDIKNIVEVGCPEIVRKVVNSAKRLRVYVGLEEKNVCNTCSLQNSCDRAYLVPSESEGARTVDVMRLLLSYALNPMVLSEAVRPPSVDQAETSARRLLSMLMNLSEASTGPAPVAPSTKPSFKKEKLVDSKDAVLSQEIEMRKGDWICPKCSFMNFSRNKLCRKCNDNLPKRENAGVELKKGDWNCPQCACLNFASRRDCFRCKDPRPVQTLNPGDWVCPNCDYLNFRRNITCLKCDSEHLKEPGVQQEHIWRKPTSWVAD